MQVFHTAGVPPSSGRVILPTMGSTRNSRVALQNSVSANTISIGMRMDSRLQAGRWVLRGVAPGALCRGRPAAAGGGAGGGGGPGGGGGGGGLGGGPGWGNATPAALYHHGRRPAGPPAQTLTLR